MRFIKSFGLMLVLAFTTTVFAQQNGSLSGTVQDTLGAVVQGASITVVDSNAKEKTTVSNAKGEFTVNGLVPGNYTVKVKAANFGLYENTEVAVAAGEKTELFVPLTVEVIEEQIEVSERDSVSTSPENNTSATVLSEKELNALPDDPDELEAALQALAGASAGPNGGQIYIDGFTGGRLPPKEAIREIRINNNPFSAEYDRLGFGRIEILTRPGADKMRGSVFGNFNDESLNSRNPFSDNRAPSQMRTFGGNLSGPIVKGKASYFIDLNKRNVDNNAIVNATILDSALNPVAFRQEFQVPSNRFSISPRVDYAINDNNTLVFRYSYDGGSNQNQGIGNVTLPTRAYETDTTGHEFRVTETMIVNPKTVNETRVEFDWDKRSQLGDNSIPSINVSDAFSGGGATIGTSFNKTQTFELQNYTTTSLGKNSEHSLKFGGRVRNVRITDRSENGFGGSFSFSGIPEIRTPAGCQPPVNPGDPPCTITPAITPIDQYRGILMGLTGDGYIPTSYTITVGNPEQKVSQTDYSIFATNDWRVNPGLTLSAGLRYENQTNINDNNNFAPRFSVAWAPGAGGAKAPSTVIRGGFGVFFERFGENNTLQALRFNGIEQINLRLSANETDPGLRPAVLALLDQPIFTQNGVTNIPTSADILSALPQSNIIRQISPELNVPLTYQGAISLEHKLPYNTTFSATYTVMRTNNVIRQRDINAPMCDDQLNCAGTPRPLLSSGAIYQYESTGKLDSNRLNFNVRSNFSTKYSLFGNYSLGFTNSDADGGFPAYSYDLSEEWGRSSGDIRHSFVVGGNFNVPYGFSLSPFINYNSGRPFNITLGQDLNNDGQALERPTFAQLDAACSHWNITASYCDVSDYDPSEIIPRNFGRSPQFFSVNLRVGRTFGFGKTEGGSSAANTAGGGAGQGGMPGIGGGPRGGGGGGMGRGGFGGFGGGGGRKPYNLNLSVDFQNIFNLVNLGSPIGNISSGRFGQSTNISGGFGGFGGFGGGAANRRINLQARFSF